MKKTSFVLLLVVLTVGCHPKKKPISFTSVAIETVFEDSVSIRAIEFLDTNTLAFAGSNGIFGTVDTKTNAVRSSVQRYDSILPEFRAVAHTSTDFFMLSVASPALLYKTGDSGQMELVYTEEGVGVFYDSMTFWNDQEGIAIGDSIDGCLSIIITRDGGKTWAKLSCSVLTESPSGEGAFAASNTNIETIGENTWVATTLGRVLFSPDKGKTWEVFETPIIQGEPAKGIYSIDFYNEKLGFVIGGDYTQPDANAANKAITRDGGKTWELTANGKPPGYKSCVQFAPNLAGKHLVAVGFTGISCSNDAGHTWEHLSDESFYTLRFLNDSIAYAAGKNKIARLVFR